jgi:putative OmpL-like beta-barrel porin-2
MGIALFLTALACSVREEPLEVVVDVPAAPTAPVQSAPPAPSATPPDRWFLMRQLQGTFLGDLLDTNRIAVSGWDELSDTASSDRQSNLPLGFNYRANHVLLQSNWLRVDLPVVQTGTTEPTFGFRSDTILPGSDYRFTIARGLFSGQLTADNGQPDLYGIDPVQFYGEAYFPTIGRGLDVKVGRFFAQFGVENIDTTQNVLASHSHTFIYDPFTHTGLLTTLKLTEAWSVQNGLVTGSDVFIDPAARLTYIGGLKWVNGPDSVLFEAIVGPGNYEASRQFNNPEIFDLVYTHKFSGVLNYSLELLYGFETEVPDIGFANWFGAVNYLTARVAPRLNATGRLEFFDDVQGQRTGFAGLYTALTAGLAFQPIKDVLFRPEVRYDYNSESRPFEGKHGLFTADFDVVIRW